MPEEVVYVLGTPGSNTVKIGRTMNLAKRVADIQRMSPVPLAVLWQTPGGHELETNLHRHFALQRSHGEWFTFASGDPVQAIRAAVDAEPWAQKREGSLGRKAMRVPQPRISRCEFEAMLEASRRPRKPSQYLRELREAIASEVDALNGIEDPLERFHSTRAVRAKIAEAQRDAVAEERNIVQGMKRAGLSWRQVGELLGVSGARAEQIAKAALAGA